MSVACPISLPFSRNPEETSHVEAVSSPYLPIPPVLVCVRVYARGLHDGSFVDTMAGVPSNDRHFRGRRSSLSMSAS